MNRKITAVAALVGALVLSACGEDPKVSGLLDDTKFKVAIAGKPAKTHSEPTTERYCAARKNGRCTAWGNRPGTKVVTDVPAKPGKPALYCVELDNVNGKPDADDQWYEVSASTYAKLADNTEGSKVTDMAYLTDGCAR